MQNHYKIDKVKLLKSLLDSSNAGSGSRSKPTKNILSGLSKNQTTNRHDEVSVDQFSGDVDLLMDENILTNDSGEEEEIIGTPSGIKNLNINSINAINSAGFTN